MPPSSHAVLFDFDFTLADSLPGIVECATYALEQMGLPGPTVEQVRRSVGLSLPASAEMLAGVTDHASQERYQTLYLARAADVMTAATIVYAGVPDMLRRLRQAGVLLGIVSTKTRERIREILWHHTLLDLFGTIVGGDEVATPKPHPAALLRGLEQLGVSPKAAVYVGDHVVDGETALAAGVPFIGVLTGTHDEAALRTQRPHAVIPSVAELPAALEAGGWQFEARS